MFKSKRNGVELTINTIIIFALALLVLIVLAALLWGVFNNSNKNTDCVNQGGTCIDTGANSLNTCPSDKPVASLYTCGKNKRCCIDIGGLGESNIAGGTST